MPTDYEKWYEHEVKMGKLPDKDGYYHYPPKELHEIFIEELKTMIKSNQINEGI